MALAPLFSTLPVRVAQQDGTFARHGLQVEVTEGTDVTAFAAGLQQDRYDIVMSVPATVVAGAASGLDILVVSRLQRSTADRPGRCGSPGTPGSPRSSSCAAGPSPCRRWPGRSATP